MGMRLIYFAIILLLVCCKPEPSTKSTEKESVIPVINAIGADDKIEVVTWNIEHFPKNGDSDKFVKAILEGLDADIFLLQEIESASVFATMLNSMDNYNYIIKTNSTSQKLAIVYKKGMVTLRNSMELYQSEKSWFAQKPPLLINMEWQNNGSTKNLTIIDVHYKCCGNNSIDIGNDKDEEYRRVKASELLAEYISDNLADKNVIVGGDFNDAINEDTATNVFAAFTAKPSMYKFVDMDIAKGDKANWSWQGWDSSYPAIHFDHLLINDNLFDEFDNYSTVEVVKLEQYFENGSADYDKYVTDHRPVYFQFYP